MSKIDSTNQSGDTCFQTVKKRRGRPPKTQTMCGEVNEALAQNKKKNREKRESVSESPGLLLGPRMSAQLVTSASLGAVYTEAADQANPNQSRVAFDSFSGMEEHGVNFSRLVEEPAKAPEQRSAVGADTVGMGGRVAAGGEEAWFRSHGHPQKPPQGGRSLEAGRAPAARAPKPKRAPRQGVPSNVLRDAVALANTPRIKKAEALQRRGSRCLDARGALALLDAVQIAALPSLCREPATGRFEIGRNARGGLKTEMPKGWHEEVIKKVGYRGVWGRERSDTGLYDGSDLGEDSSEFGNFVGCPNVL